MGSGRQPRDKLGRFASTNGNKMPGGTTKADMNRAIAGGFSKKSMIAQDRASAIASQYRKASLSGASKSKLKTILGKQRAAEKTAEKLLSKERAEIRNRLKMKANKQGFFRAFDGKK